VTRSFILLCVLLIFGCASAWTRVPGGCEGMYRGPDSGDSPCPLGHPPIVPDRVQEK